MDLRSIINTESANPGTTRSSFDLKSPGSRDHRYQSQQNTLSPNGTPNPVYQGARPPQPPYIQPPTHRDVQSPNGTLVHQPERLPYHHTPISSTVGGQYPFPQGPGNGTANGGHRPPPPYHERAPAVHTPGTPAYGQPSPSPFTPTANTPGSAHTQPSYFRPSSSHSSTPGSAQSHVQTFNIGGSPHMTHPQPQGQAPPYWNQQHQSQPGTPLGPPTLVRGPPGFYREISGSSSHNHHRTQSGSSHGRSYHSHPSPLGEAPRSLAASPSPHNPTHRPSNGQDNLTEQDRERSLSVSPKTRLPSQSQNGPLEKLDDQARFPSGQATPSKRKVQNMARDNQRPQPHGLNQFNDHARSQPSLDYTQDNPRVQAAEGSHAASNPRIDTSPLMATNSSETLIRSASTRSAAQSDQYPQAPVPLPTKLRVADSTLHVPLSQQNHVQQSTISHLSNPSSRTANESESSKVTALQPSTSVPTQAASTGPPHLPSRKRPRHEEPPIYARKASRSNSSNPMVSTNRPAVMKTTSAAVKLESAESRAKLEPQQPTSLQVVQEERNGNIYQQDRPPIETPQRMPTNNGPLGPWEPSITNVHVLGDTTRVVMDFLYAEVVHRDDIGAGPAGGTPLQSGIFEIEAKLGQLIDRNTNDRLRLPVMSECVVSKDDPNLRLAFKSSMTEAQHRALNQYLNKALVESKKPPAPDAPQRPRNEMTYVHTRESDAFFELSQAGLLKLPNSVRSLVYERKNHAKVRITTDQKTGKILAKIIKVRVQDIDIYSPRTAFDYRISVNIELGYEGDMNDLVGIQGNQRSADRNKDRMSYRHQAFQIDLTQVTPSEATSKSEKEHELEIEVSSDEVRRQGLLLRNQQRHQYDDLINGFLDNVRILARHCQ